jgi:uncharacterized SAM-dependent methyltransferase
MDVKRRLGVADESAEIEQTPPGSEVHQQVDVTDVVRLGAGAEPKTRMLLTP